MPALAKGDALRGSSVYQKRRMSPAPARRLELAALSSSAPAPGLSRACRGGGGARSAGSRVLTAPSGRAGLACLLGGRRRRTRSEAMRGGLGGERRPGGPRTRGGSGAVPLREPALDCGLMRPGVGSLAGWGGGNPLSNSFAACVHSCTASCQLE